MDCVLTKLGLKNSESLQEFSSRYPSLSGDLESDLERIWVCHKNPKEIPMFHNVSENQNEDINSLQNNILTNSNPLVTEFKTAAIFAKVLSHFGKHLTCYLFTKCFMFYNWGINSYEPVFDHLEVAQTIEKHMRTRRNKIIKPKVCDHPEKSRNGFGSSEHLPSKTVSYTKFKNAVQNSKNYFELQRNPADPSQEIFNLNKILYDWREKPKFSSRHILSFCDSDTLLQHIVQIPVVTKTPEDVILLNCDKCTSLKELLNIFILNHRKIEKNYGYGRILKGYIKKAKLNSNHKLNPIPKTTIDSFIIGVIRKTVPLKLFGCNRLRKKFFSEVLNVINGHKMENFLWFSVVRHFFREKQKIAWCHEIKNPHIQNVILLQLFKFIMLRYVFVILKNNFYITETGTSCYALRFYRKGEIESASCVCLRNLQQRNQVKGYKKKDFERFSIERKWIDTGVIDEKDLCKKGMEFMSSYTEFKQAIAKVRFLPKTDFGREMRIITYLPDEDKTYNKNCEEMVRILEKRLENRREELRYVKLILEYLLEKNGVGIKPLPSSGFLENAWKKAQCLMERFGKLYFVKADIADAFGSVCQKLLMEILERSFKNTSLQLKELTEWRNVGGRLRKISRQSFSNKPRENCILMNRKEANRAKCQNIKFLNIIKQLTWEQRIEIKGRVYKLVKGLAQGSVGKFSPQLCELYYSAMDRMYFENLINCENSIFLRGVDDYLLMTIDLKKAEGFLETVQSGIKYFNVEFNKNKLKSNLLEDITEISYLGLTFNFENLLVDGNYSKLNKNNIVSRTKLSDRHESFHFNKGKFLWKKSLQFNSLKLQSILLNNKYNSIKETRRIVYRASVVQTLRVVSLAKYLYRKDVKNEKLVFKLLSRSCNKITSLVGILPRDEVQWLFYSAMVKVVRKTSAGFGNLLVMIKYRLGLCEKMLLRQDFGVLVDIWKKDLLDFQNEFFHVFQTEKTFN